MSTARTTSTPRLEGLDLARWLALVGMVIVNFNLVLVPYSSNLSENIWQILTNSLQGRAAATFVVLAGIGFGLGAARSATDRIWPSILKRSLFLFTLGLLNQLIFDADIIHFYAVYFVLGLWFLRAPNAFIWAAIIGTIFGFELLLSIFDYEAEWNWQTFTYSGFWTPVGFFKNLFFNGWHPVFPWLAFLLFGIWISRLQLHDRRVQALLLLSGAGALSLAELSSWFLTVLTKKTMPDLAILFTTSPVPPLPLYMLAGAGFASLVIGGCLLLAPFLKQIHALDYLTPAGRMTLTLYIAHILLGMGTLELLGMFNRQTPLSSSIISLLFCALATLIAYVWSRYFRRGPLESLMRRFS